MPIFQPEAENVRRPAAIGPITLQIEDVDGTNANRRGRGVYVVLDGRGERMATRSGDLLNHLTTEEKQQIAAILDRLRALAESKLP